MISRIGLSCLRSLLPVYRMRTRIRGFSRSRVMTYIVHVIFYFKEELNKKKSTSPLRILLCTYECMALSASPRYGVHMYPKYGCIVHELTVRGRGELIPTRVESSRDSRVGLK